MNGILVSSEKVSGCRGNNAELYRDNYSDGSWSYRLMQNGRLVATDRQSKWLYQIMFTL